MCMFIKGTRHVMTLTAAREFSMSLLLLIKATKKDAGGTILQRGVDIASQTLQVFVVQFCCDPFGC